MDVSTYPSVSYSIDFLIAQIFEVELNNYLRSRPIDQLDNEVLVVIEYLEKRVAEIRKRL